MLGYKNERTKPFWRQDDQVVRTGPAQWVAKATLWYVCMWVMVTKPSDDLS